MKKIAVILCGSGFKDGSEIRESVAVLWAISQEGAESSCFALHEPQSDVVNCLTGDVVPSEQRLQIVEAARIARGQVQSLTKKAIEILPTETIPQGIAALLAFDYEANLTTNLELMKKAISAVTTVEVTRAVRSARRQRR